MQAGEELQSAHTSVQEQEVESEKEAGSDGEDDDEEVCDAWVKLTIFEFPIIHSVVPQILHKLLESFRFEDENEYEYEI